MAKRKTQQNRYRYAVIATVAALAGVVMLTAGSADTLTIAAEAESGNATGSVVTVDDTTASGGKKMLFDSATPDCTVSKATGATAKSSRSATQPPYDATANDTSDDTAAIQKAIDDAGAAGGGFVTLPAGRFMVNGHIRLKSGVGLQGAGQATVIKAGTGFLQSKGPRGGYPLITTDGADGVTIAGLTADQSGDTLNGNVDGRLTEYLIDIRESKNALVDNVHTRNPFTYSIVAADSLEFCIRKSSTQSATNGKYDQLDGIHVLNSGFGDVVGNVVDQRIGTDGDDGLVAHTIDGTVHDIVYAGNKVRGGRHGAGMQLAYTTSSDRIYNLTIQNNEFWGSPEGIHTGIYGDPGSSDHITVGGAAGKGNIFRNNDGDAVDFAGSLTDITVTHNTACKSGTFKVGSGQGNVVRDNLVNDTAC